MNGRHGRNTPGTQEHQRASAEATATIIAGLRSRLRCQEILEHPAVLSELRKLEQQLTAQLEHADRSAGRHRSTPRTSQQVSDAHGFDLKPNPLTATTPAEFINALRRYRAWSGAPSWRKMANRAGQAVVHSTMHAAMNGDTLPKFDVVQAIIIGCGGGKDDLQAFTTAWRRLNTRQTHTPAANTKFLGAPLLPFQLTSATERTLPPAPFLTSQGRYGHLTEIPGTTHWRPR